MVERPAHPALVPHLTGYTGYEIDLDPRAVHRGVPSGSLTVLIAFDEPLDSCWLGDEPSRGRFWTMISGLHTRPALVRTHGRQHGIQIDLTPLGARTLFGLPAGAVANVMVRHEEVGAGVDPLLHERLAEAPSWRARFDLLDAHFLTALRRGAAEIAPPLAEAWRTLDATRGTMRIDELARHVGWSRRRLATRFGDEFGVSPKQAARLLRFDHARRLVRDGTTLAAAAGRAGYADQAHLTREWRDFVGLSPAAHLREEFPIVQDAAAAA